MHRLLLTVLLAAVNGRATFLAHGPAGMKIEGHSDALAAAADGDRVVVALTLASLSTGIELRDKHLREDLQVDRFPLIQLTVLRSALKIPTAGAEVSGEAPGELALHGQTHPLTVHYRAVQRDGIDVSGTARINLKEYGIEVRSYLGIGVKPDVDIDVSFHLAG